MILITLGTIPYPFERVVDWLKFLLDENLIEETVFFQHGVTDVSLIKNHPLVTTQSILHQEEISEIIQNSRLIISHAGQGSTRKLAKTNKPFIIIPRFKKYREHIDDHQFYFAKNVNTKFGICYCLYIKDLQKYILNPPKPIQKGLFEEQKLADHLLSAFPPNSDSLPNKKTKVLLKNILRKKREAV